MAGPRVARSQNTTAGVASSEAPACANDAALKLPAGFCANIFADNLGHVRHMVMAPNGVLYVNTWSGSYYVNSPAPPGGFLIALQDTNGQGKANVIRRFGATPARGGRGGTGIALYGGYLYAELTTGSCVIGCRRPPSYPRVLRRRSSPACH
jgi:glucose/arabinose dehydrogenase